MQRRTVIASDGVRVSFLIAEPPPDVPIATGLPPILAIHGFASSAASGWGRTGHLDALAQAGRCVIAPDLRAHGESGKPHQSDAYTLATMLDDLAAVVNAAFANGGRFADEGGFAGHHPLGMTGCRGGADPGQLDLLGYSLGARLSWILTGRGVVSVRRMVLGGFDGRPLFASVDTERLDRLAAGVASNDRVALRHLVEGLAGTGASPHGTAIPDIPTLLVAGDRDPLASRAQEFAAGLPHGAFMSIAGRSHISAVPARKFRQGVAEFLADTRP